MMRTTNTRGRFRGGKLLALALVAVFLSLQKSLWLGGNTIDDWLDARARNAVQSAENERLAEVNRGLSGEIQALSGNSDIVEELAREELDMVREDEIFFRFMQRPSQTPRQ